MRSGLFALSSMLFISACGGGGSSADGTVFQGTLTQSGAGHAAAAVVVKHAVGEKIEGVKICIREYCSITDGLGQWGVNVEDFSGGQFVIAVDGHGISTTVTSSVPATAKEVVIDLDRDGNVVTIGKLVIDGEDHTDHDHSHE